MMTKEESEKLAFSTITDYLKEEKNIEIKNARKLPPEEGEPPDYYFEIGDHKIGCEVIRFSAQGDQFKANGNINIALEQGRKEFRDSGGPALYARFFLIVLHLKKSAKPRASERSWHGSYNLCVIRRWSRATLVMMRPYSISMDSWITYQP